MLLPISSDQAFHQGRGTLGVTPLHPSSLGSLGHFLRAVGQGAWAPSLDQHGLQDCLNNAAVADKALHWAALVNIDGVPSEEQKNKDCFIYG